MVLFEVEGSFTVNDLFTCVEREMADPAFSPRFAHLVEPRRATTFEPGTQQLRTRAQRDRRTPGFQSSRLAIVASSDEIYGISRMYGVLMDDSPAIVRTFRGMDEAREWLSLPLGEE